LGDAVDVIKSCQGESVWPKSQDHRGLLIGRPLGIQKRRHSTAQAVEFWGLVWMQYRAAGPTIRHEETYCYEQHEN
jgi:hypothetical protein